MATIVLQGYAFDDSGAAIVGATVHIYARNTTTPALEDAAVTTDANGLWTATQTLLGTSADLHDIEIINGTTKRRRKYDDKIQLDTIEVASLRIRNPALSFRYDIVPAAIVADRTLNLPLIAATDTLSALGLAETHSALKTFSGGIDVTLATDSTSSTTGAMKTAGGLGVAKAIYAGGSVFVSAANKQIAVINPTNTGVLSVGGMQTGASMTDNQSFTVTLANGSAIIMVHDSDGRGGCFLVSYISATITEISDPSGIWSTTDVDGNPGWAIYKSANSYVITIKNYMNATKTMYVLVLGWVESATAPA